jgi:hypothetical protein
MDFDFKITTWERVNVSEEHEQEVLQAIKEGKITSANDVFDFLADKGDMNIECIKLTETDEQMTVEENGGCSTIEVIDNGKEIFNNEK